MIGKCPSCNNLVTSLRGNAIEVSFTTNSYNAVTYSCPNCNAVLGCEIDPIALKGDIVEFTANAVIKALKSS